MQRVPRRLIVPVEKLHVTQFEHHHLRLCLSAPSESVDPLKSGVAFLISGPGPCVGGRDANDIQNGGLWCRLPPMESPLSTRALGYMHSSSN